MTVKYHTNYHTHTARCGHAAGEDREYVEKAIELGFSELGFADHAPMIFPESVPKVNADRLLSMRMKTNETEGYFNSLLSLREEYKNDIKIHIGFEVEYFECCFDTFIDHIKDFPVDYLILGQHFQDPTVENMIYNGAQTGSGEVIKTYVDDVVKAVETGKITYIAHPDLICYRRSIEVYEREITRLITCANEHKVPLEINLYGIQEVRNYPNLVFWQIAGEIGCDVIIGSDAHRPEWLIVPDALKHAHILVDSHPKLNLLERVDFKPVK